MTRKLHIGGTEAKEGWEILNAIDADYVDHPGIAQDLSRFENNTFDVIYASHVLEHLHHKGELLNTLKEWYRTLKSGGKLMVGVPDLDALCTLFLMKEQLNASERYFVMIMMFGGGENEYDHHKVGLNQEFLLYFLEEAGFANFMRFDDFGIFDDTSKHVVRGINISLNITAEKA